MKIEIRQLGLVDYSAGLTVQSEAARAVREGGLGGIVLVLRHPPTITLGRRTEDSEVHATPAELCDLGIELHRVDRGGGATFHYAGQAVVYPVLSISRTGLDVDRLLRLLGGAVTRVLAGYGIGAAWDAERPGAYVGGAKIASVGLHISRDVISHGLALNVGDGFGGFDLIDPCKETGLAVTSMSACVEEAPDPDAVGMELAEAIVNGLLPGPRSVAGEPDFH